MNPAVRALVHFSALNLAQGPYPAQFQDFDLIFCENVIIYLRPDVTQAIIERFYHALRPGAYLFLGYSETLWQISDRFRLIAQPHTFFYQRPAPEAAPPPHARDRAAAGPGRPAGRRSARPVAQAARVRAAGGHRGPHAAPRGRRALDHGQATARPACAPAPRAAGRPEPGHRRSPAQWTREAQEHLEAGRYTEALAAFNGALSRNPRRGERADGAGADPRQPGAAGARRAPSAPGRWRSTPSAKKRTC